MLHVASLDMSIWLTWFILLLRKNKDTVRGNNKTFAHGKHQITKG